MGDDEHEDEQWIPAEDAVKSACALFLDDEWEARLRLAQLAGDGLVRTRCYRWIERRENVGSHTDFDCAMLPEFWERFQGASRKADWSTGFFEVEGEYDAIYGTPITTVHGVEFSQTDLMEYRDRIKFGTAPETRPAPQRVNSPIPKRRIKAPYAAQSRTAAARPRKVTKDELRQWFPQYEAMAADFHFEAVRDAAEKWFHPRPVTRQPLREIIDEFQRTPTRGNPRR